MAMIEMLSLRDISYRSTSGHSVALKAREPGPVPQPLVEELMRMGCVPTDEAKLPSDPLDVEREAAPTGDGRMDQIKALFRTLRAENNADNFDANGKPRIETVSGMLGFKVNAQERNALWKEVKGEE